MKRAEEAGQGSAGAPALLLGTVLLSRTSSGCRGRWEGELPPRAIVMVTLDASAYPLQEHCRYATPIDPAGKTTFANTAFNAAPPGLRVGPWPGWRGIPEMPQLFLERNGEEIPLRYQWWGDEFATGKIRGTCALVGGGFGEFSVRTPEERLVPLRADLYAAPIDTVVPVPFTLPEGTGHPRLLIREGDLTGLRERGSPERRRSREHLRSCLDRWNVPLVKTTESKIPAGPEGLGPEDRLLVGAFTALLDGGVENTTRALEAYAAYVALTQSEGFEPLAIDTQAGEVLFLLCVGFDWLYEEFTDAQRDAARQWLWRVADICWKHLGYERDDYAQAHYLGCGMGLLAFSLLFFEEHPRAREWGAHLHGVIRWVAASLPPDGYFAHGINLWIYEFGFLLRWLELFRSGAGIDLWGSSPALATASRFRGAATSPDGRQGVTMGDPQFRVGGDSWCHFLIAARTGSGEAQWLGDFLRDIPPDGVDFRNAPARRRVYEYLWHDEKVRPRKPEEGTTVFGDGGQVFLRTDNSLFTFRSGSPLGRHRYGRGLAGGYGHSDPCNGAFLLYHEHQFIASGPGPVYRRESGLHSIVTIDGQGQIGDTAVWLPDFLPPEVLPPSPEIRRERGRLGIDSDLCRAYLPHLGLLKMQRSLQIWPGRRIVGLDTVELSAPRGIAWQWHSRGRFSPVTGAGHAWLISFADGVKARLAFYEPTRLDASMGATAFVPAYPHDGAEDSFLRISVRGKNVRFLWALLLEDEPLPSLDNAERPQLCFADGERLFAGGLSLGRG